MFHLRSALPDGGVEGKKCTFGHPNHTPAISCISASIMAASIPTPEYRFITILQLIIIRLQDQFDPFIEYHVFISLWSAANAGRTRMFKIDQ